MSGTSLKSATPANSQSFVRSNGQSFCLLTGSICHWCVGVCVCVCVHFRTAYLACMRRTSVVGRLGAGGCGVCQRYSYFLWFCCCYYNFSFSAIVTNTRTYVSKCVCCCVCCVVAALFALLTLIDYKSAFNVNEWMRKRLRPFGYTYHMYNRCMCTYVYIYICVCEWKALRSFVCASNRNKTIIIKATKWTDNGIWLGLCQWF